MAEHKEPTLKMKNYTNVPLDGSLKTAVDGSQLGKGDFQILKNMRYGELSPRSIMGMTKINSSVINSTYLKPRAGFHFRKAQPQESHVLVQAWNTGLTASRVYENITAIPGAGNFESTALWNDTSGAGTGEFSDAPDGSIIYANGKNTCVWGGNEYRCSGFIVGDLVDNVKYDYTDKINNILLDSLNVATMHSVTASIDANTLLLLHMNGTNGSTTFTDSSPTTPHTVTAVGNAQISTAQYKFGGASGLFDGNGDYLTIPDDADFDFSSGIWSIDFWIRGNWSGTGTDTIYWHRTAGADAAYFGITIERTATENNVKLSIYSASSEVVSLVTVHGVLTNQTWHHVEITENGNNYYIFIDGIIRAETTDTDRPANYDRPIFMGARELVAGTSNFFTGNLDEFRVSNVARHISNFTPNVGEYGTQTICYLFVASTRPIKGAKFYIGTANTSTATASANYWANSGWNQCSNIVDNTSVTSKTLAQTGSITFDSTVDSAKPKSFNNVYAYWYLFTFENIDSTTTVYHCTLNAPFQQIVDLWDGNPRTITSYMKYTTQYIDESINVLEYDYISGDTLSYSNIGALTSSQYLMVGFAERMTGIDFALVTGQVNANAAMMTISYWNGSSWVAVSGLQDGTKAGSVSFAKSGIATWDAPLESSEFKNSISGSDLWYFYKINWNATLSANVYLDFITGITAQKNMRSYSWPVLWQNRIWLLNDNAKYKNSALCSATDTVCVFNGGNSITLYFGNEEELVCGATLFSRFAGEIYDNLIVLKKNEAWIVNGTNPNDYRTYRIGTNCGCVAPKTLKSCDIAYEIAPGLTKHILVWQSENAVVMFDGNAVSPISNDIKNYFDKTKTECIPDSMKSASAAFYDESNFEYHWLIASGADATTLNKEFVYDVLKRKWYEVDRTTGKYLQIGFSARNTNGVNYTYGGIDTGYIERLENGNAFDGASIISQFRIPDIPLGGYTFESIIRHVRLIAKAKTNTTNTVSATHYGDCISTSSTTATTFAINNSTHRIVRPTQSIQWGNFIFHSILFSLTTNDEPCGFEPIGIGMNFEAVRESIL